MKLTIPIIPSVLESLGRFREAAAHIERDRKLAKKIRPLQKQIAAAFQAQGEDFVKRLGKLAGQFDDNARARETAVSYTVTPRYRILHEASPKPEDWARLWAGTVDATTDLFTDPLGEAILDALILGGGDLMAGLGITPTEMDGYGISWNLANPEAVAYARQHAAEQVTLINDTTRSGLNMVITQAVDEGWSYDRLRQAIEDRFTGFATGGDNPRSRRVAVYELGDAYEASSQVLGNQLVDAGLEMEKKWLTVGDDKVRPSHRDNQAQGWIPFTDAFSSGDERPPTDSGCRCTTLYRRKRSA